MFFTKLFSHLLNAHIPMPRSPTFLQKFLKNFFCKKFLFLGVGIRKQKFFVKTADFWALVSGAAGKHALPGFCFLTRRRCVMYAIKERQAWINRIPVKTFERETTDANTAVRVEVGTTGYRGGNARQHGGRTYLGLECLTGDFCFLPITNEKKKVVGIEIATCGDAGLNAISKALDFARATISDQCRNVND